MIVACLFLELLLYFLSGDCFSLDVLIPVDVKSMQNHSRVVQNEGFTKIRKLGIWMRLECKCHVIYRDLGPPSGSIFEENALH